MNNSGRNKMKKSELKAIVKECVRECLREIMQEQIVPPSFPATNEKRIINPMDDDHLRLRSELMRKGAQNSSLAQQPKRMNNSTQEMSIAGSSGYINPSDRIRFAAEKKSYTDPLLDAPISDARNAYAQRQVNVSRVPMKQDPAVLREIFDDTAATTYAEQISVGHINPGSLGSDEGAKYAPPADKYAAAVAQSDPQELFQGSQNWAMLAFEPQRR
jgi:hypothetical protein